MNLDKIQYVLRSIIRGDLSDRASSADHQPDPDGRRILLLFYSCLFTLLLAAASLYFQQVIIGAVFMVISFVLATTMINRAGRSMLPFIKNPGAYLCSIIEPGTAHNHRVVAWIQSQLDQVECQYLHDHIVLEHNSLTHRAHLIASYCGRLDVLFIPSFIVFILGFPSESFIDRSLLPLTPILAIFGLITVYAKMVHAGALSLSAWAIGITGTAARIHPDNRN